MFSQETGSFSELFTCSRPLTEIQTLVKNDRNLLRQQDVNGLTLLHAAAHIGNVATVEWLLEQEGVDINAIGPSGETPLHLSVGEKHELITELLLQKGADQVADKHGRTPLHIVTYSQSLPIAKLLLKYKPDINAVDEKNKSPFYYALQRGCLELAELFLQHGVYLADEQAQSWLDLLKEFGTNTRAKQLIFLAACRKGYIEVAKKLLEADPNLLQSKDSVGNNCFLYAAAGGHIPFAKWLIDIGYSGQKAKSNGGISAFLVAAANGQIDFAKWLLKNNPASAKEKTKKGETAFLIAAENGQIAFAKWLLEKNSSITKEKTKTDETAFLVAARNGQIEFADWLLKNVVTEMNKEDDSAFSHSFIHSQYQFAEWLIKNEFAPYHAGYELAFPNGRIIKKNMLYVWRDDDGFHYTVRRPDNVVIERIITNYQLLGTRLEFISSKQCTLQKLQPYLSAILEITSDRGDTHRGILSKIFRSISAARKRMENDENYKNEYHKQLVFLKKIIDEGHIEPSDFLKPIGNMNYGSPDIFSNVIFRWQTNWGVRIENPEIFERDTGEILRSILRSAMLLCLKRQELNLLDKAFIENHIGLRVLLFNVLEDYITDPTKNKDSLSALKAAELAMRLDPDKFIVIVRKLMSSVCDTICRSIQQAANDLKPEAIKQAEDYWRQHVELYKKFDEDDALRLNNLFASRIQELMSSVRDTIYQSIQPPSTNSDQEAIQQAEDVWQQSVELSKKFDEVNAFLLQAEFARRLRKWDTAYENYLAILNTSKDDKIKQKASFEIAQLLLLGYVSVHDSFFENGLACRKIPKFDASDDEATHNKKIALKRQILIARAIPAYEYVAQYKDSLLLKRLHAMLAGYEHEIFYYSEFPDDRKITWLPEAILTFADYYLEKLKPIGFEEFREQLTQLRKLAAKNSQHNPFLVPSAPSLEPISEPSAPLASRPVSPVPQFVYVEPVAPLLRQTVPQNVQSPSSAQTVLETNELSDVYATAPSATTLLYPVLEGYRNVPLLSPEPVQNEEQIDSGSKQDIQVPETSPSPESYAVQPANNQAQKTDAVSVEALVRPNSPGIFSVPLRNSDTALTIDALNSLPPAPSDEPLVFPAVPTDAPKADNSKHRVIAPGG